MTRRSVPPLPVARSPFARATEILANPTPLPPRRFTAEAADIRRLADRLILALEATSPLQSIDEAAIKLGARCLEIQQQTLRARRDGAR